MIPQLTVEAKEILKKSDVQEFLIQDNLDGFFQYIISKHPNKLQELAYFLYKGTEENIDNVDHKSLLDRMSSIPDELFKGTDILSITIPESIKTIGKSAFQDCSKLKYVDMKNGIQEIDICAFKNCTELYRVHWPETVETVEVGVFENSFKNANEEKFLVMTGLRNIEIKNGAFKNAARPQQIDETKFNIVVSKDAYITNDESDPDHKNIINFLCIQGSELSQQQADDNTTRSGLSRYSEDELNNIDANSYIDADDETINSDDELNA